MTETGDAPAPPPARRSLWQFGLRSMLAVTALVAVWFAYFDNLRAIRRLEDRIATIVPLVPELTVADPSRFALVKLEETWNDENRWDLHVPPGAYRLRLATRDVGSQGLPAAAASAPIASGRHLLELRQSDAGDGRKVAVLVDGAPLVEAAEPKDWNPGVGSSTSSLGGGRSEPQPADEPLILFRRRFSLPQGGGRSTAPDGPANGILLWIERYDPGAAGPGGDSSKTPIGRAASPSPTS